MFTSAAVSAVAPQWLKHLRSGSRRCSAVVAAPPQQAVLCLDGADFAAASSDDAKSIVRVLFVLLQPCRVLRCCRRSCSGYPPRLRCRRFRPLLRFKIIVFKGWDYNGGLKTANGARPCEGPTLPGYSGRRSSFLQTVVPEPHKWGFNQWFIPLPVTI